MPNERELWVEDILARMREDRGPASALPKYPAARRGCPDLTDVMDVAGQRASPDVVKAVREHLPRCPYCRACLAAYVNFFRGPGVGDWAKEGSVGEEVGAEHPGLVHADPDSRLDELRDAVPVGYTEFAQSREGWPELAGGLRPWLPYLLELVGLGAWYTDAMLRYVEQRIPIRPDQRLSVLLPGWLVDFARVVRPAGAAPPAVTIDRRFVERVALRQVLDPAGADETPAQRRFREAARAQAFKSIDDLLGFVPAGEDLAPDVRDYRSHLHSRGREVAGEGLRVLQVA
jgi:hypothetical protein